MRRILAQGESLDHNEIVIRFVMRAEATAWEIGGSCYGTVIAIYPNATVLRAMLSLVVKESPAARIASRSFELAERVC